MSDEQTYEKTIIELVSKVAANLYVKAELLSTLKRTYIERAAERNAIAVSTSTEDTREAIKDALFDWTHADDVHLTMLGGTESVLEEAVGSLQTVANKIQSLSMQHGWEMDQLKQERDEAFARVREHPQHKPEIRRQVWEMTGGQCFYCRDPLKHPEEPMNGSHAENGIRQMQVDHIVPKDAGGPDHLCNYVPACPSCNANKSAKPFVEFYEAVVGMRQTGLKVVGASE